MNKRIVYKTDNGIAIILPAPNLYVKDGHFMNFAMDEVPEGYEPATIEQIAQKDVPEGTEYKIVNVDEIPSDRYFREAFTYEMGVDMDKAREVHMNAIREKRNEKLKELDIQTLRGVDVQDEKQVLRDLPQKFDLKSAGTPEELKSLWPQELG